jgi:uncharacterized protein with PQ loop repeat
MLFNKRLFYFIYEFADLLIFLVLWASLWYIYDYVIDRYVGTDKEKVLRTNIIVFVVGVILLFIKHTLVKSPYVG